MQLSNIILAEKYRPKTIDECILPQGIKDQLKGLLKEGNIPSILMSGNPGCGKSTVARALANEMGADLLFINASMEGNIDLIRTKLTQFASTVSFGNGRKVTVLDEADGIRSVDAQNALKGFIEEFSHNHSIIFTCNHHSKIIDPIKSRTTHIDFKFTKSDKATLSKEFLKRVLYILDTEHIEYDKRAVAELVIKKFPDFRSVLNAIQGHGGKIDADILVNFGEEKFNELIDILKTNRYEEMRRWIAENTDIDYADFYTMFYKQSADRVADKKYIPTIVANCGEYQYRSAFVLNQEIQYAAFLTQLMRDGVSWK